MNPWAGLIIVVAILLFVIAWKGTQDNVLSAVLNRPYHGGSGTAPAAAVGSPIVQLAAQPSTLTPLPTLAA